MIKAVLFDLDGTLVDTEDQYTVFWGKTSRKYRPDIERLEYKIKGTTLTQILNTYFAPETHEEIIKELYEWEAQMDYSFYPYAIDFIHDLKKHGVKCAIVTSSDQAKIFQVRKAIPDFDEIFDRVLTAEDFAASKPDPDCYLRGAKVFDCSLDECVVFEDAFTGLQAGMSSGIFTIGMATVNSREEITGKCHYVLDNYNDLTFNKLQKIVKLGK